MVKEKVNEFVKESEEEVRSVAVLAETNVMEALDARELQTLRSLPASERVKVLQKITSYVGAETKKIDAWLGKEMPVCGVVIHQATVGVEIADKETGEITRQLTPSDRVVFKLAGSHDPVSSVGVTSVSFARDFLIPLFGMGDWVDENGKALVVKIRPVQVTKGANRMFQFEVVE